MHQTALERLVTGKIAAHLPHPDQIGRTALGDHLFFEWRCACPEIGALWLTVSARNEIILSCEITHTHFSRSCYIRENLTNLQRKRRIARDAVREAQRFLQGEIAATITYATDGTIHSYGWCPTAQLTSTLQHELKVFDEGITRRAWTWLGKVSA
jgi:hypothetical protein